MLIPLPFLYEAIKHLDRLENSLINTSKNTLCVSPRFTVGTSSTAVALLNIYLRYSERCVRVQSVRKRPTHVRIKTVFMSLAELTGVESKYTEYVDDPRRIQCIYNLLTKKYTHIPYDTLPNGGCYFKQPSGGSVFELHVITTLQTKPNVRQTIVYELPAC